jgi:pilus assembly protein CpaE
MHVVTSLPATAAALAANPDEELVVIGPDLPMPEVASFAERVRSEHPRLALVLLRHAVDDDVRRAAGAAGIHALVVPGDPNLLSAACTDAIRAVRQLSGPVEEAPRRGEILTVYSPKGGSGKTTISTNLSAVLGAAGHRVCLIDLDLEFGDVAISLQLTPTRSLVDAVTMEVALQAGAVDALITPYQPNVDCVLAPIEPGDAEKIPADLVSALLGLLRDRYDYVVVDTPSQLTEHVLTALDVSDHHVLLANPEIPSLKSMRLTLDMLDLLGYGHQARHVVFNRADNSTGIKPEDAEHALKVPLTARVPASRDIPASINRGIPIAVSHPDHPVSAAIRDFALSTVVSVGSGAAKRSGLSRILRRK